MSALSTNEEMGAVVIGASAGAVEALLRILPALPAHYSLPLLIVVHLPPQSESTLASVLGARCRIEVKEAEDKEAIRPGVAYLAPPNYHLLVEPDFRLSLSSDEPVLFSRPSIDVLFESAADTFGDSLTGVILTGANQDGAKGMAAVVANGGKGIVQEPSEAEATAMPLAALALCPDAGVLTLADIAAVITARSKRPIS